MKLMWSREEDMQHGFYRPASLVKMKAGIDAQGKVNAMHTVIACPFFFERQGQFNLACNQCHDRNWGQVLLTERISQGQPADWPAYRLECQSLGSLQRRLRACYFGVRAEQPPFGSDDLVALEMFLTARPRGLVSSSPGVRK